jgi:uncharacterized protein YggE
VIRYAAFAVPAVLTLTVSVAAQTPAPGDRDQRVVVSAGEGVVKRAPDRAWVNISAESRARDPREAQRANAAAMSAVMERLKGTGLPADAIRTLAYDLQPEFDYHEGRQTLRGYVARNTIEVRVDELPRLGEILDAAVTAGATSVAGVRFDLKDRTGAEREALRLAVEDARARADAAAGGAGLRVDTVVKIEEQREGHFPPPRPVMMAAREMQAAGEPPLSPGQIEIRSTVTLTASIR